MSDKRLEIMKMFDDVAQSYDAQRKHLIPCFADFYGTAVDLAEVDNKESAILDIGAGTGLFSAMLLQKYPQAKLTLIDISAQMIEMARQRFQGSKNIDYIVDDFAVYNFNQKFDMIVSSLAIHHLNAQEKEFLYQKVFNSLKKQGCFINADQVLGATDHLESLYKEDWKRKVINSPLSPEELNQAYERTKLDKMSTLKEQLDWLQKAGFSDVDCVYKYYNFVVLYACKLV
ncbi:MAG: methyltransferase domain-containing protein [Syntrophomonadaceae bacterium]|nr:methyltransferase domain-containing protein [Syntrophomonadaceae bacterium]MDD3023444.1 methyltransferase domain-containing protein [Syntrophomonadaceae bacterium]